MASPKVLVQIMVTGGRILGKAFYEAGRQAVKNAKSSPQVAANDVSGMGNATSGSMTDQLTRQHRMTLDEAQLILNAKREDPMEQIMKNYEHLFKANAPGPKPEKPVSAKRAAIPTHSHYLQSKVVRARERIEAELKIAETPPEVATSEVAAGKTNPTPPPDTPPGGGSS